MAVTITIPTALRQYADGKSSVSYDVETVGGLLRALVEQHPALGKHLYSDAGKLRTFVNIYVGDEDIRYLDGEDTPLRDGETVSIIPAIAGGRQTADRRPQTADGRRHYKEQQREAAFGNGQRSSVASAASRLPSRAERAGGRERSELSAVEVAL